MSKSEVCIENKKQKPLVIISGQPTDKIRDIVNATKSSQKSKKNYGDEKL